MMNANCSLSQLVACACSLMLLPSCASTDSTVKVWDWNNSLAAGPLHLVLTQRPNSGVDVDRIEFNPGDKDFILYVRLSDSAGHFFRLPPHIRPQWELMGAGDDQSILLTGYSEYKQDPSPNVMTRGGYTEGHRVYIRLAAPKPNVSYGVQVNVPISSDIVFQRFIPITIRDPRPNPFRF